MLNYEAHSTLVNAAVRHIKAKVDFYEGGTTLAASCPSTGALQSFKIERVGDATKFFGYGVCQKINIKLRDMNRDLDFTTACCAKVSFAAGEEYTVMFPDYFIERVNRDENTNRLSITAYDRLYRATDYKVDDLKYVTTDEATGDLIFTPYTLQEFAESCATLIGASGVVYKNIDPATSNFALYYPTGANFGGNETIRSALDSVAEATQTIYYMDNNNNIVFRKLDNRNAGNGDYEELFIDYKDYITLESSTARRLSHIAHVTSLNDGTEGTVVIYGKEQTGTTQYIYDNPFMNLREDLADIITNAVETIGLLSIGQFNLRWRGNYLLEVGDRIAVRGKKVKGHEDLYYEVNTFLLDDILEYDGSLTQRTQWQYQESTNDATTSPTTLGDALNQTYAKVDKANREITLAASKVNGYDNRISMIEMTTDSISTTVERVESEYNYLNEEVAELTTRVNATMSDENLQIKIEEILKDTTADSATSVTTVTGFTFDETGLTVSKDGTEMSTQITEDGMTISRGTKQVLEVNNQGINAENLHATTYLIIGKYSRFEDYETNGQQRTGCFWIGDE